VPGIVTSNRNIVLLSSAPCCSKHLFDPEKLLRHARRDTLVVWDKGGKKVFDSFSLETRRSIHPVSDGVTMVSDPRVFAISPVVIRTGSSGEVIDIIDARSAAARDLLK
jgi:hypothetical protein